MYMQALTDALKKQFPESQLKLSLTDRYAYAGDAGFYYLLPKAIVQAASEEDIRNLFDISKEFAVPLTFRTGGTSLSGQAITDGILVDLARHWKKAEPLNNGALIKVQPGVIGAHVNHRLQSFGKKMGPDPASITAAMMGGILSNNSSGMCCGVTYNSYHTLQSVRFMLTNGHVYDTSIATDYTRFEMDEKLLYDGIVSLQQQLQNNPSLTEKIRTKYRIKNTVGYSLNAFLDYTHPLDVFAHLLIGAEGTLAFISEAVLQTIPDKKYKTTGLLFFENPVAAAEAIPALRETQAEALEFMDRPALRSVENTADCPAIVKTLPAEATAILCEYQAESPELLQSLLQKAIPAIAKLPLIAQLDFSEVEKDRAKLWKLRKGMYPSVAAVRARGTTAMLEDVAVPVQELGAAVTDLQQLFLRYGYDNAIIFGHAKEGNLHFLITQPVNTKEELAVFEKFNDELAELIIRKYNGSLKAEHGTGRQIAPYVKEEWGEDAWNIMYQLKQLADPVGLLNPGVILTTDARSHLKDMKTMPVVEEEVDRCVECGYCENRCPSRNFTLTPRQRIQIRRSLQRLKTEGDTTTHDQLLQEYQYMGMDTCAVDGMCATDCPVSINTGDLIKRLRRENHSVSANRIAGWIAGNFSLVETAVKLGVRSGHLLNAVFGKKAMPNITAAFRSIIPSFPRWTNSIAKPVAVKPQNEMGADFIYFPTCITRMMGADSTDKQSIAELLPELAKRAGLKLKIASGTTGVCCGQLFSSKGFADAYRSTVNQTFETLWKWSDEGKLPVVMDVTSCTHSIQHAEPYLTEENKKRFTQLQFIDSIDFAADHLLPRLQIRQKKEKIVFHPVCTVHKMGNMHKLQAIGKACATDAVIPFNSGCCGMAGDRGFYYPGLTASATKDESAEVMQQHYEGYYSSGKTCEMAMQEATQQNYQSLLYLLRDVS
jgi:D-lactate dehydrogenase